MNWIKILYFNITLTLSLISILLISPPIIFKVYAFYAAQSVTSANANIDLGLTERIPVEYHDFITWRRGDFKMDGITVSSGERIVPNHFVENNETTWFFGGSTTFGYGVRDEETYPAFFQEYTGSKVRNFGESGYIARQSLSYLNNLLISEKFETSNLKHIVFFDGVNDVAHRCRSEISGLGTGRETYIRNQLKSSQASNSEMFTFAKTFEQVIMFSRKVSDKFFTPQEEQSQRLIKRAYSCSQNEERAKFIAKSIVTTWIQASHVAKARGIKFLAVLQPVSLLSNAINESVDKDHPNNKALKKQFEVVYPLILSYAEAADLNFIDATGILDECTNCYFDFCHVSPKGNEIIAQWFLNYTSLADPISGMLEGALVEGRKKS